MPYETATFDIRPAGASIPDVTLRSTPDLRTGLSRGLCRLCPACGQGKLFCGYLAVRPFCPVCGNDNRAVSVGRFRTVCHYIPRAAYDGAGPFLGRPRVGNVGLVRGGCSNPHLLTSDARSATVCEGRRDRPLLGIRREAHSDAKTLRVRCHRHRSATANAPTRASLRTRRRTWRADEVVAPNL